MRVLYTRTEVRNAIRELFSSSRGRRVAVTAFVGDSAEAYLPHPPGIEVICWPKAGGTNPNAIRDLLARKVKVFFADAVHMKVYWAEGKGAVVTSANLSTYALGAGGLKEIGILLPPGKVDIDKIVASLSIRPVSDSELRKLDIAHKDHIKLNRTIGNNERTQPRTRSYGRWYLSAARASWKLGWYWYGNVYLSAKAKTILEKEHGSSDHKELMTAYKGSYRGSDWILCFNVDDESPTNIEWMFAHHIIRVSPSDKKAYDPDAPYQVIQAHKLSVYDPPPFQTDKRFKTAFKAAVKEYGGIPKVTSLQTTRPSRKLIDMIYEHYKRIGG